MRYVIFVSLSGYDVNAIVEADSPEQAYAKLLHHSKAVEFAADKYSDFCEEYELDPKEVQDELTASGKYIVSEGT